MATPTVPATPTSPWAAYRPRGETLRDRHPFAAELLVLYLALLDVWEQAWRAARADPPAAQALPQWTIHNVLPQVVDRTVRFGPHALAAAVGDLPAAGPILAGWLAGEELKPVERYLARAALRGPLEAVDPAAACARDPAPRGGRHCPHCGGLPQLSYRSPVDDPLVSGQRHLSCARCGRSWPYTGNACASCGETAGARRVVFAERHGGPVVGRRTQGADEPLLPHLRVEGCSSCSQYLIDVDLGVDGRAVPEVDELTALPLDLFAGERGLTKVAPNLMGF
jgi:hypothetical protein